MYCTYCAAPLSPGLSYCNRCGANLRERETTTKASTATFAAFLTAITLIAIVGLGIMLGGSIALREAGLVQELVGFFMLFAFLITGLSEVMLIRQLSRLTASTEGKRVLPPAPAIPYELRSAPGEPVNSVTDNTTRTLEYARRERN